MSAPQTPVDTKAILRTWWPLAASWLLMGAEMPAIAATLGHMADSKINLATYGGLVFPISLVIEAPIIMLLAASTALVKDWDSYIKLRRFMLASGALLTLLHVAIAFTPLYDWVATVLMNSDPEVIEPGRIGLRIMTPWTWSIAYRRFQQGVLIRYGHANAVGIGTLARLAGGFSVMLGGYLIGSWPGIVVATCAVSTGVIAEALYVGIRVQRVLRDQVRTMPPEKKPLNRRIFLSFYIPLALTPLLTLLIQPIGAKAMNNMPRSIDSLAAWTGVHGLGFMLRSVGIAFNEVVVILIGNPHGVYWLRRFTWRLAIIMSTLLGVIALMPMGILGLTSTAGSGMKPLAVFWFESVTGLDESLAALSATALLLTIIMPGYAVIQSWFTGALVHAHKTRGVTEAVAIYLIVSCSMLALGIKMQWLTGIYMALVSFTTAGVLQTLWLWHRSRGVIAEIEREQFAAEIQEEATR